MAQLSETDNGTSPPLIAALTDGRAGNEAQALGLAEAIARARPARIAVGRAALGGWRALVPARAWAALGRLAPGAAARTLGAAAPLGERPDLLIGAGRRVAPMIALLGARTGVPTVQLLDPQMPVSAFDLVVAPAHDGLRAPNALASLGALGRVTPDAIAAAAQAEAARFAGYPAPRLAVLIGGPGRMARWGREDAGRLLAALDTLATAGWTLLVTTSRRTPADLAGALAARLDPHRHFLFRGAGSNPYPGLLGHAEAVLVTQDSVNMASEAASSGLPLHVFEVARPTAKARAFHAALAGYGAARPFAGEIGRWNYPPLAEADRIAAEVLARLLPRR